MNEHQSELRLDLRQTLQKKRRRKKLTDARTSAHSATWPQPTTVDISATATMLSCLRFSCQLDAWPTSIFLSPLAAIFFTIFTARAFWQNVFFYFSLQIFCCLFSSPLFFLLIVQTWHYCFLRPTTKKTQRQQRLGWVMPSQAIRQQRTVLPVGRSLHWAILTLPYRCCCSLLLTSRRCLLFA